MFVKCFSRKNHTQYSTHGADVSESCFTLKYGMQICFEAMVASASVVASTSACKCLGVFFSKAETVNCVKTATYRCDMYIHLILDTARYHTIAIPMPYQSHPCTMPTWYASWQANFPSYLWCQEAGLASPLWVAASFLPAWPPCKKSRNPAWISRNAAECRWFVADDNR